MIHPRLAADLEFLPGHPDVTAFAALAKGAIMLVILAVTIDTAPRQGDGTGQWRAVTFHTPDRLVLARQLEAGLVMVKIPIPPIPGVMALFTIGAQSALVYVTLRMACPTSGFRVLECWGQMAFLALDQQMATGEWEA